MSSATLTISLPSANRQANMINMMKTQSSTSHGIPWVVANRPVGKGRRIGKGRCCPIGRECRLSTAAVSISRGLVSAAVSISRGLVSPRCVPLPRCANGCGHKWARLRMGANIKKVATMMIDKQVANIIQGNGPKSKDQVGCAVQAGRSASRPEAWEQLHNNANVNKALAEGSVPEEI